MGIGARRRPLLLAFAMGLSILPLDAAQSGSNVSDQASQAAARARQWRSDATLVMIEGEAVSGVFEFRFSFYSPSDQTGMAILPDGQMWQPGRVDWGTRGIPAQFIDLPAAIAQARRMGMSGSVQSVRLMWHQAAGQPERLAWLIVPVEDANMRTYPVEALTAAPLQPGQIFDPMPGNDRQLLDAQKRIREWLGAGPGANPSQLPADIDQRFSPWLRCGTFQRVRITVVSEESSSSSGGLAERIPVVEAGVAVFKRQGPFTRPYTVLIPLRFLTRGEQSALGAAEQVSISVPPGVAYVKDGPRVIAYGGHAGLRQHLEAMYARGCK
jgi:hypothetical protein